VRVFVQLRYVNRRRKQIIFHKKRPRVAVDRARVRRSKEDLSEKIVYACLLENGDKIVCGSFGYARRRCVSVYRFQIDYFYFVVYSSSKRAAATRMRRRVGLNEISPRTMLLDGNDNE